MKKLLVLMLVLGMASLANATLSLSFDGATGSAFDLLEGATAQIGIYNDTDAANQGATNYLIIGTGNPASWVDGSAVFHQPPVPDDPDGKLNATYYGIMDIGFGDVDIYEINTAIPTGAAYGIGVLTDATLQCDGLGEVVVTLLDGNFGELDSMAIAQIPEPITMVLLGLGGLFLRRRK